MQDLLIRNLIDRARLEEWPRDRVVEVFQAVLGDQFDWYKYGNGCDTMGDVSYWPVNSPDNIVGPDACGYNDAQPGYSVLACPFLAGQIDVDRAYWNTRCLPVVEWGLYPNPDDEGGPELLGPNTGCVGIRSTEAMLRGFVHPDGTVVTSTGMTLKSLVWWPEFVVAASKGVTVNAVLPAEALAIHVVLQEGAAS